MKPILITFIIALSLLSTGCLQFHRISYELRLKEAGKGTAYITITDIRSDGYSEQALMEDTDLLFDYIYKSSDFISAMREEGKTIISRDLYSVEDTLVGKAVFSFSDITDVEGIQHEDGFYYLTMDLADSIISTNGTVIKSEDFKRIIWDEKINTLQFEMLSNPFEDGEYTNLVEYYNEEN